MPNTEGYISIADAMKRWGHARTWWDKQIDDGKLTAYDIPGERATFLRVDEVEAFLQAAPPADECDNCESD